MTVADTLAHFYGGQSTSLGEVPDGGFADAELCADLFLGQKTVFFRFHVDRQEFFTGGVDCVNHKLMEVGKGDVEEDIGRDRIGGRSLKKGVQIHCGEKMN